MPHNGRKKQDKMAKFYSLKAVSDRSYVTHHAANINICAVWSHTRKVICQTFDPTDEHSESISGLTW